MIEPAKRSYRITPHGVEYLHTTKINGVSVFASRTVSPNEERYGNRPVECIDRELQHLMLREIRRQLYPETP